MAFIRTIPPEDASGKLLDIYQNDQENFGFIPNYTKLFSLRPEVFTAYRNLSATIKSRMPLRRYELVTMASARALKCSY